MTKPSSPAPLANVARFIAFVAAVLTAVMVLFPPFISLTGTEYAFLFSGPEWSRRIGAMGDQLGLKARIHWVLLMVQVAAVWAIAFGARRFLIRSLVPLSVPLMFCGFHIQSLI